MTPETEVSLLMELSASGVALAGLQRLVRLRASYLRQALPQEYDGLESHAAHRLVFAGRLRDTLIAEEERGQP